MSAKKTSPYGTVHLIQDVPAYFFSAENKLIEKGLFTKGRTLKLNLATKINDGGEDYYLVENVRYNNIYVPIDAENAELVTARMIINRALALFPQRMTVFAEKDTFQDAVDEVVTDYVAEAESAKSDSDGLDEYKENAFTNDDGFINAAQINDVYNHLQKYAANARQHRKKVGKKPMFDDMTKKRQRFFY